MIGIRTSLRIEVLRELHAGNMQYGFLAHLRAAVRLAHPESFSIVTGARRELAFTSCESRSEGSGHPFREDRRGSYKAICSAFPSALTALRLRGVIPAFLTNVHPSHIDDNAAMKPKIMGYEPSDET